MDSPERVKSTERELCSAKKVNLLLENLDDKRVNSRRNILEN